MLYPYGELKAIPFLLVDSNGDRVTAGHTFIAADAVLIKDGSVVGNVGTQCTHISGGLCEFVPTGTQTQSEYSAILITDSVGTAFIDNAIILFMGGNAAALYDAGQ